MGDGFKSPRSSARGTTLFELLIYMAVMAILGVPLAMVTLSVSRSSAEGDMLAKILERNRSALQRITSEYRESLEGTTTITNANKTLRFTSNGGFSGAGPSPGANIRYEFRIDPAEVNNTVDDNQNGLVDESILVRVNEATAEEIVLTGALSTPNCSFTAAGTGITINLTTAGHARGSSLVTEATRSLTIFPRN